MVFNIFLPYGLIRVKIKNEPSILNKFIIEIANIFCVPFILKKREDPWAFPTHFSSRINNIKLFTYVPEFPKKKEKRRKISSTFSY
jgi:hypothetical protein